MNKEKLINYLQNDNIHFIECEKEWCNAYGYEKSQMKEDTINYIKYLQQKEENFIKYLEDFISKTDKEVNIKGNYLYLAWANAYKDLLERIKNNNYEL